MYASCWSNYLCRSDSKDQNAKQTNGRRRNKSGYTTRGTITLPSHDHKPTYGGW